MFVVLVIQHAMRIRHIVIYGPPGSTILSQISHIRYHFCDKVIVHKMRVLIFSTTFETFFTLRIIERDRIKYVKLLVFK